MSTIDSDSALELTIGPFSEHLDAQVINTLFQYPDPETRQPISVLSRRKIGGAALEVIKAKVPATDYLNRTAELNRRMADLPPGLLLSSFFVSNGERSLRPINTLGDWQWWVAERWVEAPGSDEAAAHFEAKTTEELKELLIEIEAANAVGMLSEMGDLLYCMTARAINEGIDVEAEMLFYKEVTNCVGENASVITLEDIDLLSDDKEMMWFLGSTKVIYNFDDDKMRRDLKGRDGKMLHDVVSGMVGFQASAARAYRRFVKDGLDPRDPYVQIKASRVEHTCLDMMRYISIVARSYGYNLSDVLNMVQAKQLKRINDGAELTKKTQSILY